MARRLAVGGTYTSRELEILTAVAVVIEERRNIGAGTIFQTDRKNSAQRPQR